jgi:hypothetical protein
VGFPPHPREWLSIIAYHYDMIDYCYARLYDSPDSMSKKMIFIE